ncbi:unnamed protein product, partial [Coregonus sp. 'balchen']
MASTCIQLCQRGTYLLSRTVGMITLQYSTDAQHCPAALRNYFSVPVLPSMLQRRQNPSQTQQRWKLGVRSYYESHAKIQPSQTKHKDTDEFPRTNMVPYQNSLSHQLRDGDLEDAPGHSALEEISDEEAVRMDIPAALPAVSISLKDYVNESETLSKLVQLGVRLWKLEQRPKMGSMLLRLDVQTDVAPRLVFLKQLGVEDSRLGYPISHNPFNLTESLENLQARYRGRY